MNYNFENKYVALHIIQNGDYLTIEGSILNPNEFKKMELFAPNPIDRMMNYSGSGLPFTNPMIAFENTPNYYLIPSDGIISCIFQIPNSYYTLETQKKINPSVFITLYRDYKEPVHIQFSMQDSLPLKTVYHRVERTGPDFYQRKADIIDVSSQYEIIRDIEFVKEKGKCA